MAEMNLIYRERLLSQDRRIGPEMGSQSYGYSIEMQMDK